MPNTDNTVYRRVFASTLENMSDVICESLEAFRQEGWLKPEQENTMRLCLEEALVNAIVHGNCRDASRKVRLHISGTPDECIIQVYDEGKGFDPEAVSAPGADQLGGRGVCIIRHFMSEISYDAECNCLSMVFSPRAFAKGVSST